ncbi:hypothetical protein, unlikely [Trypanosoma brucei gambiense DAL972]|uniref:Uncharacterized protein n=1 Tax=Trypanosoma brucei gambiense (strain MHOM/CI/86/DAL972) TaxID=679716 RepID=C9ZNQ9_TRYB9|nr:hypothetical protein, unlikely [Trypanosoma brucei gambiense DAL972]CBH11037.1 hypothetical protein, unlikely [Trypanosoma brucei gambiense DAL972]|eukprot:XP_011773324.1 hypothetical protein, unlikely [Trypanosoma brucei gambiense DAL972]
MEGKHYDVVGRCEKIKERKAHEIYDGGSGGGGGGGADYSRVYMGHANLSLIFFFLLYVFANTAILPGRYPLCCLFVFFPKVIIIIIIAIIIIFCLFFVFVYIYVCVYMCVYLCVRMCVDCL